MHKEEIFSLQSAYQEQMLKMETSFTNALQNRADELQII